MTIDPVTGDMYLQTADTTAHIYYVEKYHPGASSTTVVATVPGTDIFDMRFNKNDNMLYALQPVTSFITSNFIKINPASGAISTVSSGLVFNGDFHSATLDPCTNRYIYSTLIPTMSGDMFMLYKLDVLGAIVQHDTTSNSYQGPDVEY